MQCDSNVTKVTKSSYEVPNVIIVTNCSFDVTKRKKALLAYFLTELEFRVRVQLLTKKVIAAAVLNREEPPFFASRLLLQKLL